jgi:hypothetical protein
MDKIRFATGTSHVWQGYDDGVTGMAGPHVLVTADTLREWIVHIYAEVITSDFDRTWNRLDSEEQALAFGDAEAVAPDGKTPLYRINTFFATIVQRYDDSTYMWVNEDAIDSETGPWTDRNLTYHGFLISAELVAEGRSDTPLIRFEADDDEAFDLDTLPEGEWYGFEIATADTLHVGAYRTEAERDEKGNALMAAFRYVESAEMGVIPSADTLEDALNVIRAGDWVVTRRIPDPDPAVAAAETLSPAALVEAANEAVALNGETEIPEWETDPERLARKRKAHEAVQAWEEIEETVRREEGSGAVDRMHWALDALIGDYVPGYNAESSPEPGQGEDYGPNREMLAK